MTKSSIKPINPDLFKPNHKIKPTKNYLWTLHDYTEEHLTVLKEVECTYIIWGHELCPESGRPHLQGYIVLNKEKTITAIKKFIGINTVHYTVADGDSLHNYKYCTKTRASDQIPNEVVVERGERPLTQREKGEGEKLRWDNAKQLCKEGKIGTPIYIPLEVWGHILSYADDRQYQNRKADFRSGYAHILNNMTAVCAHRCSCTTCSPDEAVKLFYSINKF